MFCFYTFFSVTFFAAKLQNNATIGDRRTPKIITHFRCLHRDTFGILQICQNFSRNLFSMLPTQRVLNALRKKCWLIGIFWIWYCKKRVPPLIRLGNVLTCRNLHSKLDVRMMVARFHIFSFNLKVVIFIFSIVCL